MSFLKDLLGSDDDDRPDTDDDGIHDAELVVDGQLVKRWLKRGGKLTEIDLDKDDDET